MWGLGIFLYDICMEHMMIVILGGNMVGWGRDERETEVENIHCCRCQWPTGVKKVVKVDIHDVLRPINLYQNKLETNYNHGVEKNRCNRRIWETTGPFSENGGGHRTFGGRFKPHLLCDWRRGV